MLFPKCTEEEEEEEEEGEKEEEEVTSWFSGKVKCSPRKGWKLLKGKTDTVDDMRCTRIVQIKNYFPVMGQLNSWREAPLRFHSGSLREKKNPPLVVLPHIHTLICQKCSHIVTQILCQKWQRKDARECIFVFVGAECIGRNVFWDGTPRHIFKDSKNLWVRGVTHAGKQVHPFRE